MNNCKEQGKHFRHFPTVTLLETKDTKWYPTWSMGQYPQGYILFVPYVLCGNVFYLLI